eukprot:1136484-Pelagomonas_calceolata.AAC.10
MTNCLVGTGLGGSCTGAGLAFGPSYSKTPVQTSTQTRRRDPIIQAIMQSRAPTSSLHQIRKQTLYPELHRQHIQGLERLKPKRGTTLPIQFYFL